ncbi:MAG: substrate-binding domain-containing protein [Hafnia sp.]
MKPRTLLLSFLALCGSTMANTPLTDPDAVHRARDGTIRVYGPGGPHTALQKAAAIWSQQSGIPVKVIYGPESRWTKAAQRDADLIFSASEQSMTAFLETYNFLDSRGVLPLYLQRSVIAVKKGNPKGIHGVEDLLTKSVGIVVTEGAGVYNTSGTGVWEDVAGRSGKLSDVINLRGKIIAFEKGSGAAFSAFKRSEADAWITWSDWPISHPNDASLVEIEPGRRIYRDMNVVVARGADIRTHDFVHFLTTPAAVAIFAHDGWQR